MRRLLGYIIFLVGSMKTLIPLLLSVLWVSAAFAAETVTVNLNTSGNAANARMNGFLKGMIATQPATSVITPLNVKNWRCGYVSENCAAVYDRAISLGSTRVIWLLSDLRTYNAPWPGDGGSLVGGVWVGGDFTAWLNLVRTTVQAQVAAGRTFHWEPWNEPDANNFWHPASGNMSTEAGRAQFKEMWRRTVLEIKSIDPNAIIVGPSLSFYGSTTNPTYWGTTMHDLLLYMRANNVLPTIINYHELLLSHGPDGDVGLKIQHLRAWLSANGINITRISINEIMLQNETLCPGCFVHYVTRMERNNQRIPPHGLVGQIQRMLTLTPAPLALARSMEP